MLMTRPPPTVAELTAYAIHATTFVTEVTGDEPHELRICAELAASIAGEKWESAHQVLTATLPADLIAETATALEAHGQALRDASDHALYSTHARIERTLAAVAAVRSSFRGVLPLAAAEALVADVETHLDHVRIALTRARDIFAVAIDRIEWAAARHRKEAV